jgi:simple sugar transport system permease protein
MPVKRMTMLALTISGALGGLAGACLVFGSETHRLQTEGFATGFTGSAGFNGIVAALFGGLHPLFTIPSSFLFGGLLVGANAMQRAIQIPVDLVIGLNGLIVVFVVSSNTLRERLSRYLSIAGEAAEHEDAAEHEAAAAGEAAPSEPASAGAPAEGDDSGGTLESEP